MRCTLLIPRLFWPRDVVDQAASGLELHGLQTLLARARREQLASVAPEAWLCQAFELEPQPDWPVAPFTLLMDGGDPGDCCWLRADPVHLCLQGNRLRLIDSSLLEITPAEAADFVAALNHHFAAEGIDFVAPQPQRWYARVQRVPDLSCQTLATVAGRDIDPLLPAGPDALAWHGVANETQMMLHDHDCNAAREARGKFPVNSIWFWGAGRLCPVPGRHFTDIWSNEPLGTALATRADIDVHPLPGDATSWLEQAKPNVATGSHLLVMSDFGRHVSYGDTPAWRAAITQLETRWFRPLLEALQRRRIERLVLAAPAADSCLRFELAPRDLLRFWRMRQPLSAHA